MFGLQDTLHTRGGSAMKNMKEEPMINQLGVRNWMQPNIVEPTLGWVHKSNLLHDSFKNKVFYIVLS